MDIVQFLTDAVGRKCSDIYIIAGRPLTYKVNGKMMMLDDKVRLDSVQTERLVKGIYFLAGNRDSTPLVKGGDDDFSFALPGISRFRVSAYKQRGSLAAVIRIVNFELPNPDDIGIPKTVLDFSMLTKGLLLVTGAAGSGKSTTLACLIDHINKNRNCHIITLEDPLEYLHRHNCSIVSQREISSDTESFSKALNSALRQAPDVILLGEMPDVKTISLAMAAAESGHLVISTMNTIGAANTISRIIDSFPDSQKHQVRQQLALMLQAVVSQQLIPSTDQKIVSAFEVMVVNQSIRAVIRTGQIDQIDAIIQSAANEGMVSMDSAILDLYRQGRISGKDILTYSSDPNALMKKLQQR